MTALSEKNVEDFYKAVWHFLAIIAVAAPLFALSEFVQQRLVLAWRVYLTELLVAAFFANGAYYNVIHMGGIDNPDQRITQDVAQFVMSSTNVMLVLIKKVFNCAAFAGVLWSVSPVLVYVLFGYALAGTWLTTSIFGRKLMALQYRLRKQEADLRFSLVRVRENCESIAFYAGAAAEEACVRRRFRDAVATTRVAITWTSLLDLWSNMYKYATILVPSLVTAPRYFSGAIQLGVVSQAGYAFSVIESAVSFIVSSLESLSSLAAETDRLYDLFMALDLTVAPPPPPSAAAGAQLQLPKHAAAADKKFDMQKHDSTLGDVSMLLAAVDGLTDQDGGAPQEGRVLRTLPGDASVVLQLARLTATVPRSAAAGAGGTYTIARDMNMQLLRGQSLLIMGPSGCGKSSLLRLIAGLWTQGHGTVACVAKRDCCFLPQKPYMPLGSLRQQLLFPDSDQGIDNATSDAALRTLAAHASLPRLADASVSLDTTDSWAEIFSVGEQQRIAFLRLFRAQPQLAFLDEASSALDIDTERDMYTRLAQTCHSYVSVGHRPALTQYHSHVLHWQQPGQWGFTHSADYRRQAPAR